MINTSLDTGDIREAKKKRDVLNGQLEDKSLRSTTYTEGQRFRELVKEMQRDRKFHPSDWDNGIYPEALEARGANLELQAYMTVNGKRDYSLQYRLRLSEAVQMWKEDWGSNKTEETLKKVEKSASEFSKYCFKTFDYLDQADIALEDITRKVVYSFIKHMGKSYKKATIQATISRLKMVWEYAETMEEVEGNNPFVGHKYSDAEEDQTDKRIPFTNEEISLIRSHTWEKPVYSLLVELGIFTGCRISELCNIKKKHVIQEGGVTALYIEKGKTVMV
nr:phage integrase SAM-like domain-containing protein [Aliiglaciecola lipolytica]